MTTRLDGSGPRHAAPQRSWEDGVQVPVGERVYVLRRPVRERAAPDLSWVWREATGEEPGQPSRRVRLRQVELHRLTRTGARLRDGLGAQADVLSIVDGRSGAPRVLARHDAAGRTTLITALPVAPTWSEVYGPGPTPLDRLTAAAVLGAAAPLGAVLRELHRLGQSHRALCPDAVLLLDRHRRGVLRDAGLAGFGALPAEGVAPYRAPEQEVDPVPAVRPGPATDVYQFAALLYHTLTGRPPGPAPLPPVSTVLPRFPATADTAFAAALRADPAERPAELQPLLRAIEGARVALLRA